MDGTGSRAASTVAALVKHAVPAALDATLPADVVEPPALARALSLPMADVLRRLGLGAFVGGARKAGVRSTRDLLSKELGMVRACVWLWLWLGTHACLRTPRLIIAVGCACGVVWCGVVWCGVHVCVCACVCTVWRQAHGQYPTLPSLSCRRLTHAGTCLPSGCAALWL